MSICKRKYLFVVIAVLYILLYLVWNKVTMIRTLHSKPVEAPLIKRHLPPQGQPWPSSAIEHHSGEDGRQERAPARGRAGRDLLPTPSHQFDGLKKILYWNDAYGDPGFFFGQGHEPFVLAGCPVSSCYATHNRTLFPLDDVDAVLWHLRANDKSLPPVRSPHTYYIFWMIESALYTYEDVNFYNGVFNWTITYRMDSDFPKPYGKVVKTDVEQRDAAVTRATNYAAAKTKMAVWFVSNCYTLSEREILVRSLQNSIIIDIYGECGQYKCPKNKMEDCYKMVEDDYKFYFSFENSLCYEYVTEKLFSVLKKNIVPVVYGLGYDHLNLPPHSYIDVLDFKSVKHLADYLQYLDTNDTAYNEYFRWKSEGYEILTGDKLNEQTFCDLCERLHQVAPLPTEKSTAEHQTGQENLAGKDDVLRKESLNARLRDGDQRDRFPLKERQLEQATQPRKYGTIAPEHRKVYKNMYKWFVENHCIEPYTDHALASFLHGDDVVSTNNSRMLSEEALLPYRLRPHKDLWT